MNRRLATILVAAGALLVLVALAVWWRSGGDASVPTDPGADGEASTVSTETGVEVSLYFPGPGRRLHGESRLIPDGTAQERAKGLVAALLEGPRGESLVRPLPQEVTAEALYIGTDGVVYLDLRWADGQPPAGGSAQELLAVYSLVNTLCLNLEECRRVAILWNGSQQETLSGHMDIGRPLAADPKLIAAVP